MLEATKFSDWQFDMNNTTQEDNELPYELVDEKVYDLQVDEYYFHYATIDEEGEMVFIYDGT